MTIYLSQEERDRLAHEFAQAPVKARAALVAQWTAQHGQDQAYELMLKGTALIVWPDTPEAFRAQWSSPTVNIAEIRQTTLRLSDDQVTRISANLRGVFLRGGRPEDVWALAHQLAGVA